MNKFNTADLCDDHNLVIAKPIFKSFGSHTHCYGKIKTVEAIDYLLAYAFPNAQP